MDAVQLRVRALLAPPRGVLALDTSSADLAARLRSLSLLPSAPVVRDYLEMVLGTPDLAACTSGVVMDPGHIDPGRLHASGILAGVRADVGDEPLTADVRDRVTSGLDGLAARLARLRGLGVDFAVWSAVASPVTGPRGMQVLTANSHAAARFAHLCRDLGMVAVVRVGTRAGEAVGPRRAATMAAALLSLGGHFHDQDVDVSGVVVATELEPGDLDAVARPLTVLPPDLGGVLLTGRGPTSADAAAAVTAGRALGAPWPVSFYAGRHVTLSALRAWRGHEQLVAAGRQALLAGLATVAAAAAPTLRVG